MNACGRRLRQHVHDQLEDLLALRRDWCPSTARRAAPSRPAAASRTAGGCALAPYPGDLRPGPPWSPGSSDTTIAEVSATAPERAGMNRPVLREQLRQMPTDCNRRVLPPEFGPVTSTVHASESVTRSQGTGLMPLIKQQRVEQAAQPARLCEPTSSGRHTSRPASRACSAKPSVPRYSSTSPNS